jgi:hypothetical protein
MLCSLFLQDMLIVIQSKTFTNLSSFQNIEDNNFLSVFYVSKTQFLVEEYKLQESENRMPQKISGLKRNEINAA